MITKLKIEDVPSISSMTRYYDGELFFADNISSVPNLMRMFQVRFIAFMICMEGELELKLNGNTHLIRRYDALFVEDATVVDLVRHSDDFSCKIFASTPDAAFSFINKSLFETALKIQENPVIHFTDDEISLMHKYYELADYKLNHPDTSNKDAIRLIVRAYAFDLLSCVSRHLNVDDEAILRQGDKLYRRFLLMVNDENNLVRSVKWFADALCVSPKYLTAICRQRSNKTASELIAMGMVGRIKQLLLYSDLSIKEISARLSFTNLSFFGKYVKKHLGQSPNTYRRTNGYGR